MLLDTTFLIDLYREEGRRPDGPAHTFLTDHPDDSFQISVITYGEFAEGFTPDRREQFLAAIRSIPVLPLTEVIAEHYGVVSRTLRVRGVRIGDNDLWIAATALHHDLDVVTRNSAHFARVDGLRITTY